MQDYKGNILQARFKWYARDCDIQLSESQISIVYRLSVRLDIQVDERKAKRLSDRRLSVFSITIQHTPLMVNTDITKTKKIRKIKTKLELLKKLDTHNIPNIFRL